MLLFFIRINVVVLLIIGRSPNTFMTRFTASMKVQIETKTWIIPSLPPTVPSPLKQIREIDSVPDSRTVSFDEGEVNEVYLTKFLLEHALAGD